MCKTKALITEHRDQVVGTPSLYLGGPSFSLSLETEYPD
jgi:hypothetical protein